MGSLNIDKVYSVQHFAAEGETILSEQYNEYHGGKGLNQSIALARAGMQVFHAGAIGADGAGMEAMLRENGVNTDFIRHLDSPSGHALIQVTPQGKNCIIVHGGANSLVEAAHLDAALQVLSAGDIFLTQNETSCVAYAMKQAKKRSLTVVFNPSPITEALFGYPLELVDIFILNETEGKALSGKDDPAEILDAMHKKFPQAEIVLTIGEAGAMFINNDMNFSRAAFNVQAEDTTAAGDTFTGYFLAGLASGKDRMQAMDYAGAASAIAITKKGASSSIPSRNEVEEFLRNNNCRQNVSKTPKHQNDAKYQNGANK
jgi:ribokinase